LKDELRDIYIDWHDVDSFDYMIITPQSKGFSQETNIQNKVTELMLVHKFLFNFITAIRLCHDGEIIPGPLVSAETTTTSTEIKYSFSPYGWEYLPTNFGYLYGLMDVTNFEFDKNPNEKNVFRLRPSDTLFINDMMDRIFDCINNYPMMKEIVTRFNSSYYGNLKDRLIDQMIAFESLFIGDDKELGYKLAIRTAFLIGNNVERNSIFTHMKHAYDIRGKTVHGSEHKEKDDQKLKEIIPKNNEYLRRSIVKFISILKNKYTLEELKKGKDKKLAKLDENIVTNGKTLTIP
jgi:hypothetical protein